MADIFLDHEKTKRQIALWEETQDWITRNPEAYARFVELALEKVGRRERFSIGALTEVVRWDAAVRFNKKDFKILNGYRRYIAIRLMQDHPEIETWITTKRGTDSVPDKLRGFQKPRAPVVDPAIADLFDSPGFSPAAQFEADSIPPGVIDPNAPDDDGPDPDGDEVDFDELFK